MSVQILALHASCVTLEKFLTSLCLHCMDSFIRIKWVNCMSLTPCTFVSNHLVRSINSHSQTADTPGHRYYIMLHLLIFNLWCPQGTGQLLAHLRNQLRPGWRSAQRPHLTTPAEKAMAPHSSTGAWKIPWAEEPGGLKSMGSRSVRHDWATSLTLFTFVHGRRKWQPTPVFLPGES